MSVYFDNAATSYPKPKVVCEAVDYFQRCVGASPGRGTYQKSREADRIIFKTRNALANLFNIPDLSRIVFTANATESINLALKGYLQKGNHVITTAMEHNAVWRPLKTLEQRGEIELSLLRCPFGNAYNPEQLTELIKSNTALVIINHASNVTGTIMPLKETGKLCREFNLPLLVDAAQTAGVYPIDVQSMGIDLLAFTGHKGLMGPPGTGGLYIREGLDLVPLKEGGTGSESLLEAQPAHLPDRFEAGTLNAPGIAGLGAGVQFILDHGLETIRQHEVELTEYTLEKLKQLPDLAIYGPRDAQSRTGVISFNFTNIAPEEVTYVFDEVYNIMARSGLHCAPQAHRAIETIEFNGTVRISFGYFNTQDEIDILINALENLANA